MRLPTTDTDSNLGVSAGHHRPGGVKRGVEACDEVR